MLIDARTLPQGTDLQADLCIVGGGPAGITLALQLIGQPLKVCLLESGGLKREVETQALYDCDNVGHPYPKLPETRSRLLGGSSNCWAGNCRKLNAIDFEERAWVEHSGWPIGRPELDAHYEEAHRICQLGPFTYDVEDWEYGHARQLPLDAARLITRINQFSPPTRFSTVYRDDLVRAPNMRMLLHANVTEIEATEDGRTATRAQVASLHGPRFSVSARYFVLATGGLENARLLLLSDSVVPGGLGNQHDLVGRFFMEHFTVSLGLQPVSPRQMHDMDLYEIPERRLGRQPVRETRAKAYLELAAEAQRREQLSSATVTLERLWQHPTQQSPGYAALRELVTGAPPRDVARQVGRTLRGLDDVATGLFWKLLRSYHPVPYLECILQMEQVPNPLSRATLTDRRDALGQRRVRLDWQLLPDDFRSIRRVAAILGEELGRLGMRPFINTLDADDNVMAHDIEGTWHHIGTTRMSRCPTRGVVDPDCRVHGMSNLFMAGSSVFPTSGHSVPTLTIVAMAVRMGAHLRELLGGVERGDDLREADLAARVVN